MVHPGEHLTIAVDATPFEFRVVFVVVCDPTWSPTPAAVGPPYRFALQIPSSPHVRSGSCALTAVGVPPSGIDDATYDKVDIDIERPQSPKRLTIEVLDLHSVAARFKHAGEIRRLVITGIFADGSRVNLTRSSLTVYESSAPSVITVNADGIVTAVGNGSATITVKNGSATAIVSVTVPDSR